MAVPIHSLEVIGGGFNKPDRISIAIQMAVASLIGGGAGQSITTAVTFADPIELPYAVFVQPDQDAVAYIANKTRDGFDLVLYPRLAANTLAVGATDILIVQ